MLEMLKAAGISTVTSGTIYYLLVNGLDILSYATLITGAGFSLKFLAMAAKTYGKTMFIN
ncbi:hypothetical protein U9R71_27925 [Bacillus toyonensis]|uniref:hypothetical protein n=1 Tax=Bacillus toyonensis TaxID=155322 RepID=UPI000BEBFA98|nr:hypothetical protein [Bacillus toyonensis]MBH0359050.1 hypothetical protein [Bacillus toyonensis biovar Thuringiensis]PEA29335.1 hypothetical protein COO13_31765 [Bacillus toyonensis]